MIFTVEVNFEIEIEAENEDEADGIARNWEPIHPQIRRYPKSIYVKPEYVVVMYAQENLKQE